MILYRFERDDFFRVETLKQNKIWMSLPIQFNDPFDCTLKIRPPEESARIDVRKLKSAVRELYESYTAGNRGLFDEVILSEIRQWMCNDEEGVPAFVERLQRRMQNFGVECFTEVMDNPLMWGYYASSHRGFCIEYDCDPERIAAKNPGFSLDPIVYHSRLPEFDVSEILLCPAQVQHRLYSTKAIHWAHEREYRLINFDFDPGEGEGQQVALPEGIRIKAIYAGLKAEPMMVEALKGAACELDVPIYQMAVRSHGDYILSVHAIE